MSSWISPTQTPFGLSNPEIESGRLSSTVPTWTAVDAAEDEENLPRYVQSMWTQTQNIANICKTEHKMIDFTDYVSGGPGTTPWQPDCKDLYTHRKSTDGMKNWTVNSQ